jgi:pyruvate/2-oxoglutarate dehydrogenase complex dihydrolipoamide acyltransferase (E2) component
VTWGIAYPSPEHEMPLPAAWVPGAALEPSSATALSRIAPETSVPQLTLTTAIDAAELLLFRSDLRSTLEGVAVCAAGRALSAHPDVNFTLVERPGGPAIVPVASSSVELVVLCDDGLRSATVDAGDTRSLSDVRDAVAAAVDELRCGRMSTQERRAALSLRTFALSGAAGPSTVEPPASSALVLGRLCGETKTMQVELSVDARVVDAAQASRLFATIVRLLEHPYRRLH